MRYIVFLKSILVPALILAGVVVSPVMAQDKGKDAKAATPIAKGQATKTVLLDNDKVYVYEARYKPGDENTEVSAGNRVVRTIQGGTMQRTYPDGKTEKAEITTGRVIWGTLPKPGSPQYTNKNVGNTEIVQYVVTLKDESYRGGTKK